MIRNSYRKSGWKVGMTRPEISAWFITSGISTKLVYRSLITYSIGKASTLSIPFLFWWSKIELCKTFWLFYPHTVALFLYGGRAVPICRSIPKDKWIFYFMYVYIFEGLWRTVLLARFFTETVRNQGELRRVTMHIEVSLSSKQRPATRSKKLWHEFLNPFWIHNILMYNPTSVKSRLILPTINVL